MIPFFLTAAPPVVTDDKLEMIKMYRNFSWASFPWGQIYRMMVEQKHATCCAYVKHEDLHLSFKTFFSQKIYFHYEYKCGCVCLGNPDIGPPGTRVAGSFELPEKGLGIKLRSPVRAVHTFKT